MREWRASLYGSFGGHPENLTLHFTAAVLFSLAGSPFAVLYSLPFLWVMIRFGLLPCALMFATTFNWPLTSDFSAWYAHIGLIVVALVLALAVWSFRNALGGRKVLQDDLL